MLYLKELKFKYWFLENHKKLTFMTNKITHLLICLGTYKWKIQIKKNYNKYTCM